MVLFFVNAAKSIAGDVVINEFQVEPSGSYQWVELFNKGNDTVDISNWIISDSADHGFPIPSILLNSHQCISFTSSRYYFNTATSDGVRLKNGESIVDSHDYEKSPGSNVSLGRSPDGADLWVSFTSPTKDALNENGTSCSAPTATSTPTITPTLSRTPTHTPTPTNVPTPTKMPTTTKPGPTATKTPTPPKTPTPTKSPTPTTKPSPTKFSSAQADLTVRNVTSIPNVTKIYPTAVLGASASAGTAVPTETASGETIDKKIKEESPNYFLFVLPVIGVGLIIGGAFYYLKKRREAQILYNE